MVAVGLVRRLRAAWSRGLVMAVAVLAVVTAAVVILTLALFGTAEPIVRHMDCSSPSMAPSLDRLLKERAAIENDDGYFLVPNYVHMYRAGEEARRLTPVEAVCLEAVFRHQQPDLLFIHTDDVETTLTSLARWRAKTELPPVQVLHFPTPRHVFGLPFSDLFRQQHVSDLVRLRILRKFGGIFIDNRVYLGKDVNSLRREEFAVTLDNNSSVDNSVIVAHRDSRLLKAWISSYSHYRTSVKKHHLSSVVSQLLRNAHEPLVRFMPDITRSFTVDQYLAGSHHPRIAALDSWPLHLNDSVLVSLRRA